jgi:hypothetical protein
MRHEATPDREATRTALIDRIESAFAQQRLVVARAGVQIQQ